MNIVMLTGNTGKNPEIKYTGESKCIANFSLATKGFKKGDTDWHNCVAFGKTAELIETYVKKGQRLDIVGRLQTRSWDKDGVKQYRTEVVVDRMEFAGKSEVKAPASGKPQVTEDVFEDSIPF